MRNAVDAPRKEPNRHAGVKCDVVTLAKGLLAAMIAHDPEKAPLDSDVRYTENGQPLAIGDGLWRTLTARGEHAVYLTGEQDVGVFTPTLETDIPGQLMLRIRHSQGRIIEIEALIVRQEIPMLGKLIGTSTLMAPPQLADFDARGSQAGTLRSPSEYPTRSSTRSPRRPLT